MNSELRTLWKNIIKKTRYTNRTHTKLEGILSTIIEGMMRNNVPGQLRLQCINQINQDVNDQTYKIEKNNSKEANFESSVLTN